MGVNSDYIKTLGGVLALVETIVGVIVVGLCVGNAHPDYVYYTTRVLYLLVVAVTCFITTFLVFVSNLCHQPTGDVLPKTIFDLLFNCFACILYLPGALAVLITAHTEHYYGTRYNELVTAAVFAVLNTILYLVSAIFWKKDKKVG